MRRPDQAKLVKAFNKANDVGVAVRAYPGVIGGERGFDTTTRTEASVLSGHTAVVWVDGHSSCIALSHIKVLP